MPRHCFALICQHYLYLHRCVKTVSSEFTPVQDALDPAAIATSLSELEYKTPVKASAASTESPNTGTPQSMPASVSAT